MDNPQISVITPSVRPAGLALVEKALKRQTVPFEWIKQGRDAPLAPGTVWSLNRDYNKAIQSASGELIVSWQDYTYAPPDTLARFWQHHLADPRAIIGAYGHKYTDDAWTVETWHDPRHTGGSVPFCDIEWNLCALPADALRAVGGFDESLDQWYGMDGYSVLERLSLVGGWHFVLDPNIRSFSLEHGRSADWDEKNAFPTRYQAWHERYVVNPKLDYLK